ncbi:arginyl-tRNA synthetase [Micromonospora phaseoli]|uniref:Arginine--tRNA ligase n=1 Tax=Micromonospora phaseoli TaxID=1144548 RepID=A0A1H6VGW2_9ACTN|nr:arginine--tRNA ligase [Micromonospora phaseoli]PZV93560.1 arginyl-tRNA synthetase [Micromonospora phaseoli]GIJ80191.1 arginine--tRNA ligase [Micromonospora phaseoli]SEJ03831.1 arginyl-tRNA synthetase [Micromonospora phaseoli]
MTLPSLASSLSDSVTAAAARLGLSELAPQVRRSEHADFQADGVLAAARILRRRPRDVAAEVVAALPADGLVAAAEVAGPGFVNLDLTDRALLAQLADRLAAPRLGVGTPETGVTTVIDYSQPNIAKEMHVGHLRSTIVGDALVRILEHLGGAVVRRNHIGDWGTQFGMLIQHRVEHPEPVDTTDVTTMRRLAALYRRARAKFDADPGFADRARQRVVALQAGDPQTVAAWRDIVAESTRYFTDVYDRLGVRLTDADAVGESAYNAVLPDVAADLERQGVAVTSDGALCVFFDDVRGPDGEPTPLIVRKRDGGFGYAATDLAALRQRVTELRADRLLYVVDARQALHFRMVFDTARRSGWLPPTVPAVHVAFGTVLGPDGRPFKTRAGDTVRLVDLLTEAVDRARDVVAAKNPGLTGAALDERARQVGVGAVKYADLATSRTRDYTYDPQRMLALAGNTGVYLQYAHARIRSILGRAGGAEAAVDPTAALDPAERALILDLDTFADTLTEVVAGYEPHRLCGYLYRLAQTFTTFYEHCPVLRAEAPTRGNRLALCRLTGDTLRTGLELLGIDAPDQL